MFFLQLAAGSKKEMCHTLLTWMHVCNCKHISTSVSWWCTLQEKFINRVTDNEKASLEGKGGRKSNVINWMCSILITQNAPGYCAGCSRRNEAATQRMQHNCSHKLRGSSSSAPWWSMGHRHLYVIVEVYGRLLYKSTSHKAIRLFVVCVCYHGGQHTIYGLLRLCFLLEFPCIRIPGLKMCTNVRCCFL